ncbi:MAG: hypothetical protein V4702_03340 [Patescibacteria group bacterium]
MSVPQILTFPTPLRGKPSLGKFKQARKRFSRLVSSRIKSIKRYLLKASRQHYFLPKAFSDLRRASAQNEDIVLASVISGFLLVYACSVIAVEFVVALSNATYAMSEATDVDMGLLLLVAGPLVILFCMLLAAATLNFLSLAVMDGANRKVYRTIRTTFKRALGAASRLTSAWFLLGIVHFARMFAVFMPVYLYVKWFSDIVVLSNRALIAVSTFAIVWLIVGLIKYSLVPYVALFEPQYLLTEAFGRSRQLVNKQAVVFLLIGSLVLSVYVFGLYKLCVLLKATLGVGTNLLFVLGLLAGIMLANGAMVMLYRKRKLARS